MTISELIFFLHLVMNLQSYWRALPNLLFWISDPATILLKPVLFLWEFNGSVFMKVVIYISKIMWELESHKNNFFAFIYEFLKLQVCIAKITFWDFWPSDWLAKHVLLCWFDEVNVFVKIVLHILKVSSNLESQEKDFSRISYAFPNWRVCISFLHHEMVPLDLSLALLVISK